MAARATVQTEQPMIDQVLVSSRSAMSRFYFHLQAGGQVVLDDEGIDLPDLSAAQREAMQSARELLADAIKSGKPEVAEAFVITDEVGRALAVVLAVLPKSHKN